MTIKSTLQSALSSVLRRYVSVKKDISFDLEIPHNPEHGDYAAAIALRYAKENGLSPREFAQRIVAELETLDLPVKVDVAGAGFINFSFPYDVLLLEAQNLCNAPEKAGFSEENKATTIVFEYSHPNIAKPLSVAHLRSTAIGEALKRIYQHLGYTVIADNYLGDYGTQFGKITYAYKQWGDRATIEKNPMKEFLKLYVRFHEEAQKDPKLEDYAREEFLKLEHGDEENRALWRWVVDESMKDLMKLYEMLDTSFTFIHGESFYENMLEGVVQECIDKGIATVNEDSSVGVCFDEEENLPSTIIRRSDGGTLYLTRDLAADKYYEEQFAPKKVVHVVSNEQTLYFKHLAAIRKKLGSSHDIIHVSFGLMRFPEGRMSTRKGRIIFLEDYLEEAIERAYEIVNERVHLDDAEKRTIAKIVGIGAVKYADLSQNRKTDIVFSWEKMLSLQGNSGPYLQYTCTRIQSLLSKAEKIEDRRDVSCSLGNSKSAQNRNKGNLEEYEPMQEERLLARKLLYFSDAIVEAAEGYFPNILCTYLYELASIFNAFYNACPILTSPKSLRIQRILLARATGVVLRKGLFLLGIGVPDKM